MNKKSIIAAVIVVLVLAISVAVGFYVANQTNPSPEASSTPSVTPTPEISFKIPPVIDVSIYPGDVSNAYVTQGGTFQENLTIASRASAQIQIPLSLKLTGYNNSAYVSSTPQDKIFNYTFSPNVITMDPNEENRSVLTVEVANDAPLGLYVLNVELGNAQVTHLSGHTFLVQVNAHAPNQTAESPTPTVTPSPVLSARMFNFSYAGPYNNGGVLVLRFSVTIQNTGNVPIKMISWELHLTPKGSEPLTYNNLAINELFGVGETKQVTHEIIVFGGETQMSWHFRLVGSSQTSSPTVLADETFGPTAGNPKLPASSICQMKATNFSERSIQSGCFHYVLICLHFTYSEYRECRSFLT